jgi:hypothetical protein
VKGQQSPSDAAFIGHILGVMQANPFGFSVPGVRAVYHADYQFDRPTFSSGSGANHGRYWA